LLPSGSGKNSCNGSALSKHEQNQNIFTGMNRMDRIKPLKTKLLALNPAAYHFVSILSALIPFIPVK
jgi:hypothetical protein